MSCTRARPRVFSRPVTSSRKHVARRSVSKYQREFLKQLLPALGYEYNPAVRRRTIGTCFPSCQRCARASGAPGLWVPGSAWDVADDGEDPLELPLRSVQYRRPRATANGLTSLTLEEVISRQVVRPLRAATLVIWQRPDSSASSIGPNGTRSAVLRFDLDDISGRRETSTLQATAALLHSRQRMPERRPPAARYAGRELAKHAFAVSEDLKYALREASSGWATRRSTICANNTKESTIATLPASLTKECLR